MRGKEANSYFVLASLVRLVNFPIPVCGIAIWWGDNGRWRMIQLSPKSHLMDSFFFFSLQHIWVCWENLLAHTFGFYRSPWISRVMDKPLNWAVTPSCLWWQHFNDFLVSRTKCKGIKIYLTHGFRGLGPSSVHPFGKDITANKKQKARQTYRLKTVNPEDVSPQ